MLGIVLAAGLLAVEYASQATEWAVMTDELQTSKLATSIAETLSPVPQIHGAYYGALNQLYPLVLAPLYGSLSAPTAFDAAHVLNAFLFASAAWPAYLLGRAVTGSRAGGRSTPGCSGPRARGCSPGRRRGRRSGTATRRCAG